MLIEAHVPRHRNARADFSPRFAYHEAPADLEDLNVIAVIFEVWPAAGKAAEYFEIAGTLRADLATIEGFISIERFESVTTPGKYVSLSFWRDEEAVRQWRNLQGHREAQAMGRGGVFADYRLRVASVIRDYGMAERSDAPEDSREVHDPKR
jgi:heme-degrading monooxygenase HmoA